mmetsp:Transcript_6605/g.15889  ORF Transcript_6605/g.15889 Transcript_6605/m.15889 type:complete len:286 (-) Transcript_6605:765-1622(-)
MDRRGAPRGAGGQTVGCQAAHSAGRGEVPHKRGRVAGVLTPSDPGQRQGGACAGRGRHSGLGQALDAGLPAGDRQRCQGSSAAQGPRADPDQRPALEGCRGARLRGRRTDPPQPRGRVLSPARGAVARACEARDVRERPQGAKQGARGDPDRPCDLDHRGQARGGQREREDGPEDPRPRHQVAEKPRGRDRPGLLAEGGGECREGQAAEHCNLPGHCPHGDRNRRRGGGPQEDVEGGRGGVPPPRRRRNGSHDLRSHALRLPGEEGHLAPRRAARESARHQGGPG